MHLRLRVIEHPTKLVLSVRDLVNVGQVVVPIQWMLLINFVWGMVNVTCAMEVGSMMVVNVRIVMVMENVVDAMDLENAAAAEELENSTML